MKDVANPWDYLDLINFFITEFVTLRSINDKSIIFNLDLLRFPPSVELHFYDCGGISIILWSNYFQLSYLIISIICVPTCKQSIKPSELSSSQFSYIHNCYKLRLWNASIELDFILFALWWKTVNDWEKLFWVSLVSITRPTVH